MKTFRSRVVNGCLLILICALMNHLTAQSTNSSHFSDLLKGSRVTFVGNSLFEQAQSYGTLEYMLINAWPDKNLTFRNLGWSGDTAEGSARSYISTPPQPYELLIQQIEATNPDVVVVAYGSIEAYQGEQGLKAFEENLNRLIDTIQGMEAQIVLMSPIPQIPIDGLNTHVNDRNEMLSLYNSKIKEIANGRGLPFADLFDKLHQLGSVVYKDNGIHLNESGYYQVGAILLSSLGYEHPSWSIRMNTITKEINCSGHLNITDPQINRNGLEFILLDHHLPFPDHTMTNPGRTLVIQGLKKGIYTLFINQENIVSAPARDWEKGVRIIQGQPFVTARHIREKLIQINDLYFQSYRPLNRTYLVGMRLHEQKQNAYELEVNKLFINRLEDQIALVLDQESYHYKLKRIK